MNEKTLQNIRRGARLYVEEVFDELELDYTERQVAQAVEYLMHMTEYLKAGHNLAVTRIAKVEEPPE